MPESPEKEKLSEEGPERRKFLTGAAAAAVVGAVGATSGAAVLAPSAYASRTPSGLMTATSYVRADAIPGNPYVKAYPELASRVYIPGYGFGELPFPTEPGAFLAKALHSIVGSLVRCICIVPEAWLSPVGWGAPKQRISMEGGVAVTIGGGTDNILEQIANVILHPGEHISRGINNILGAIFIDHDTGRPLLPSLVIPIDLEKIWEQLIRIINPANWGEIIGNFLKNPLSIFNELIRFFFPVRQVMNFNVQVTCEKLPGVTLMNKENIQVENKSLDSFPPKNAQYNTSGTVELVDANNPKGGTLCVIDKWQPTVDHRKNLEPYSNQGQTSPYPKVVDTELPCSVD